MEKNELVDLFELFRSQHNLIQTDPRTYISVDLDYKDTSSWKLK